MTQSALSTNLRLPVPPPVYSPDYERQRNRILELAWAMTLKRGQDVEVGGAVVIWTDTTGVRWALGISQYAGLTLTNLVTSEVRTFYAAEQGTTVPVVVDHETIYFQQP